MFPIRRRPAEVAWVEGRLGAEGICGERMPGQPLWTVRVRLTHWAASGCAASGEPLEITGEVQGATLNALQRRFGPGDRVVARVRFSARRDGATLLAIAP